MKNVHIVTKENKRRLGPGQGGPVLFTGPVCVAAQQQNSSSLVTEKVKGSRQNCMNRDGASHKSGFVPSFLFL